MTQLKNPVFKRGFGVELNTLSGSDEVSMRFMEAFDDANVSVYWRYVYLLWWVKWLFNVGSEAALKQNIKVINNFVYGVIQRKREQMKNGRFDGGKDDILSRFLIESEKDPENVTDKYLRDVTVSFIIVGKDTSANTLTWFFYMLCKHPLIQEKIAQELRAAVGLGSEDNLTIGEFA